MENQTSDHILQELLNGRYQLQKALSQKAGRQTFLANDLQTQKSVVVKILKLGSDFEWDYLKLFEREAQILKTLSHPQIPKYLDYFEIDVPDCKGFALVQQYIEAPSLEAHLAAGETFSISEIQQIAEDCLKILIDLHQQNPPLIHRDLKPSNILLGNRSENGPGQVYLVDFGAVQNQALPGEGTITVVGTYGYMPPEQFGGRSVPASDLYSLGATLVYLLTGVHPANLPQKDLRIQFEQVTQLSSEFSCWLGKMVEPSLDRRFNSAAFALQTLTLGQQALTLSQPEFVENPENRCPVVLLLDTSSSMRGAAMTALNAGVARFKEELFKDEMAALRVELAIVTFGPVRLVQDFTTVDQFMPPMLSAEGGNTPMGEALEYGLELLESRKQIYKQNGIQYYRPWMFLITDGTPTDRWTHAAQRVRETEASRKVSFFAVGVQGADLRILRQIAPVERPPVIINGLDFKSMFVWLSASMSRVSAGKVGDVQALPPVGWGQISL
jgi:uncharacterized protein YegL